MSEGAIVTVLLAAAGGLGVLALRFPALYRSMVWALIFVWTGVAVAIATWNMAMDAVSAGLLASAEVTVRDYAPRIDTLRPSLWTLGTLIAALVYILVLAGISLALDTPDGKLGRKGELTDD